MIFVYYICALLLGAGTFCVFQVWSAALFTLGLQLVALSLVLILHFFALDPENAVYLGILLFGLVAFIQSGLALNHLKKALIDEPPRS